MFRSPGPPLAVLTLTFMVGCPPPSLIAFTHSTTDEASTGGIEGASTGPTGEVGSTDGSGSGSDGASTGIAATGDEAMPPRIVSATLTPSKVIEPGMVALEIEAEAADWVAAWDNGALIEPEEVAPGLFVAELAVTSALSNGTHHVTITPYSVDEQGESVTRDFTAALPEAGSEAVWEAGPALGEGLAAALVPGPDGDVFEFGTLDPGGAPHCYLRRRGPDGSAGPDDDIAVQPGLKCTAIDTGVDADGRLLLLSEVEELGMTSWRLDRHDPWNKTLSTLLYGPVNSTGNAIATDPSGEIVVCGSMPSEVKDSDMAVWSVAPKYKATFDLEYEEKPEPHKFNEVAIDCAFVGGTLVLAGEAHGEHPDIPGQHTRHAVVEYDPDMKTSRWIVASKGPGALVQSSAQAIAAAGKGRYVTAGYVCGKPCIAELQLHAFELGVGLVHTYKPTVKTTAPTGIAWHPAGYAVVSAGEIVDGWWTRMWAQAWVPGETESLWTYSRSDVEGVHWALDVAIGKYGWIHLVGVVDLGGPLVPAFVTVYP